MMYGKNLKNYLEQHDCGEPIVPRCFVSRKQLGAISDNFLKAYLISNIK